MSKHDIVYFVKEEATNEELRYSLRTVEHNFPHGVVWFYGGCPPMLQPDRCCRVDQAKLGRNKWQRVAGMLRMVCGNEKISDDFYLFNDDFFIMKPVKDLKPHYNGDLYRYIVEKEEKYGRQPTKYTRQLRDTVSILSARGCTTLNYAVHTPMLINKKKALETLDAFPGVPMFRSLYGNHHGIGGDDLPDVKYLTNDQQYKGESLVSTSDMIFKQGAIGAYIRETFDTPSKWEIAE